MWQQESVFSTNYTKRHLKSNNIAVAVKDIEIRLDLSRKERSSPQCIYSQTRFIAIQTTIQTTRSLPMTSQKLWKRKFETLCAIWHRSNSQQNMKNTHGPVFFSVKLQALLIVTLLHECFSRFLDCTNGTKSRNASHLPRVRKTYRSLTHIYPMLTFYIPWIHQKTQRFLLFSVGI